MARSRAQTTGNYRCRPRRPAPLHESSRAPMGCGDRCLPGIRSGPMLPGFCRHARSDTTTTPGTPRARAPISMTAITFPLSTGEVHASCLSRVDDGTGNAGATGCPRSTGEHVERLVADQRWSDASGSYDRFNGQPLRRWLRPQKHVGPAKWATRTNANGPVLHCGAWPALAAFS